MAEIIMRAGRCGHHYDAACSCCRDAEICTNHEMDRLRAANAALVAALEPFSAGAQGPVTEDHLIAAERAYRKHRDPVSYTPLK